MYKTFAVLSFAVLSVAVAARAGTPLNDTACAAAWKKAGGADLSSDAAKPFIANFDQVDVDHNGAINWDEFSAGCKAGLVNS
jgi:hypothetical protein